MFYYLNDDKTYIPCNYEEWSKQNEQLSLDNKKHVGFDEIGDFDVSTVWIGIDHGMFPDSHAPMVFETMIFSPEGDSAYWVRSSNWDEALEYHNTAIEMVHIKMADGNDN